MKIDPVAVLALVKDASRHEGFEFPLEAGGAYPEVLSQIAEIPPTVGVEERGSKDCLPDLRKESIERFLITHYA